MSGIVALLHVNGDPAGARDVHRMLAELAHRGRDGREEWMHRNLAFGLCTSNTTSFTSATLAPLGDAPDALRIAADVRLDNRDELYAALGIPASEQGISDAGLIARAYERWGERCVEHLHGDFAFVLWDPGTRTLMCARDRMGVKPLYYHHGDRVFAAASEPGALLASPYIVPEPDEQWVGDYLAGIFNDTARTFHRGIHRLPPAHVLLLNERGMRLQRYARLDPERRITLASDAAYAEVFLEHFTRAVADRMAGGRRVGGALSGGLDSSSVVAVMRSLQHEAGGRVPTFSIVFDDVPASDERPYIESVVASGGIDPAYIRGDRSTPLPAGMIAALPAPFFSPNLYLHWRMFAEASAAGIGVWLDGLDGDTTVSHGMAYLPELARRGKWGVLYRELRGLAARSGHGSWMRSLRRTVLAPLLASPVRRGLGTMRGTPPWGTMPINSGFAQRIGLRERFNELTNPAGVPATLARDHLRRLEWGIHSFVLEVLDRIAALHGIEPRYPFYDWRLIEFCLALPPEQKLHDGWGRIVLRRAMEGLLPPEVQWRTTKGNPGPAFHRALRAFESERMEAMIRNAEPLAPYVDVPRLREMHDHWKGGIVRDDEVMALWKCLTLWLRLRAA